MNLFCWHGSYIFFSESTGSLEGVRCGEGEPQNLPIAAPPKGYTTPLLVEFILTVHADASDKAPVPLQWYPQSSAQASPAQNTC